MKGVMLRQLLATGVVSPGLVNRLLSSGASFRPASILRGMAFSLKTEKSAHQREDKRPIVNAASPQETKVNVMPVPTKQTWWRPDPVTGAWVPEGCEGQVTTSTSPSRITRIRTESTASLEDKRWWTSMEELPDMDRDKPQ